MALSRFLGGGLHEALACSGSNKTENQEKRTAGWAGDVLFRFVLICFVKGDGDV